MELIGVGSWKYGSYIHFKSYQKDKETQHEDPYPGLKVISLHVLAQCKNKALPQTESHSDFTIAGASSVSSFHVSKARFIVSRTTFIYDKRQEHPLQSYQRSTSIHHYYFYYCYSNF